MRLEAQTSGRMWTQVLIGETHAWTMVLAERLKPVVGSEISCDDRVSVPTGVLDGEVAQSWREK